MRLNAYLAKAGVASRRRADEMIKAGKVQVNGRPGQLNDDVGDSDIVELNTKQVKLRKSRFILIHKPAGIISSLKDTHQRTTVTDLVKIEERVAPVGRLDKDTTGALLLTNDGEIAHNLMHPSFNVNKIYEAVVKGQITDELIKSLSYGIALEDGKTAPASVKELADDKIALTIHEGRKHQIKRMLAAVGLETIQLHRSKYGPLTLAGLKSGQWRDLTENEVKLLKLKI